MSSSALPRISRAVCSPFRGSCFRIGAHPFAFLRPVCGQLVGIGRQISAVLGVLLLSPLWVGSFAAVFGEPAYAAASVPVFLEDDVLGREFMPSSALVRSHDRAGSEGVDFRLDSLQMRRIHATLVAAEMIDLEVYRHGSDEGSIGHSVRELDMPAQAECAVSVVVLGGCPAPATIWCGLELPHETPKLAPAECECVCSGHREVYHTFRGD